MSVETQPERVTAGSGTPMPCPNCTIPVNQQDAKVEGEDAVYRCPACGALLRFVVPFVASSSSRWQWELWPGQINPGSEGVGCLLAGDDRCQAQDMPDFVRRFLTARRANALRDPEGREER